VDHPSLRRRGALGTDGESHRSRCRHGIVYADATNHEHIIPSPFGLNPQSGLRVTQVVEGRVTACIIGSSGGETASLRTHLTVEPTPQGYR
jgi:hypothetical protein